ncbi:MAG TPA: XisI protein [Chthonomonadaceae bacterium]|nr:XisI protein [Chthonomonadaceae bacterium]
MDTPIDAREIIKRILREYAALKPSYGDIESEVVFDDEQGHYELIRYGWDGQRRVHGCLLHVDIKGDKIWIQYDGTEEGIAPELVEAGIPRDRIVLGFRHPDLRTLTDFAVA